MNIYTTAFSSLHTAKIAGKQAPHKAVLMLSIVDLVEDGVTSPRRIASTSLNDLHIVTDSVLSALILIGLNRNIAA